MIRSSSARVLALALALSIGSLGLAACNGASEEKASTPPAGSTPGEGMGAATLQDFRTDVDMKDLMAHVIDYNAFEVWHRQGWIIGDTVTELFPTDDEGWHAAESAAFTVAEASNLLLLPGRPRDDERRWVDYAHQLYDGAMKAQGAALARDKNAFFDAGTEMYRACLACHQKYLLGTEPPDAPSPADLKLKPLEGRAAPPPNQ